MIFRFDRLKMVVQDRPGSSSSNATLEGTSSAEALQPADSPQCTCLKGGLPNPWYPCPIHPNLSNEEDEDDEDNRSSSGSGVILGRVPEPNAADGSWPPLHPDSIPEWVRKVWPASVPGLPKEKTRKQNKIFSKSSLEKKRQGPRKS